MSESKIVKARFWVQKVTLQAVSQGAVSRLVELAPVVRAKELPGGTDNVDWSKYTPSGKIELNVSAEGAGQWFQGQLGKDVSITFEAIEE